MRTLMKDLCGSDSWSWYDYTPMIESFGKVIAREYENDYQGDTWVLLVGSYGKYGYLCFGWGSCSGCDALQGCNTIEDVQELSDDLYNAKWFDSSKECLDWFEKHDWNGDYSWGKEERDNFVKSSINYLNSIN